MKNKYLYLQHIKINMCADFDYSFIELINTMNSTKEIYQHIKKCARKNKDIDTLKDIKKYNKKYLVKY